MMKINNKLLKQILRKQSVEWNLALIFFILQLNFKIVTHFHMFFTEIFLNVFFFNLKSVDFTFAHIFNLIIKSWHEKMTDFNRHISTVFNYLIYKAQIWNYVKKLSNEKKNVDAKKYDRDVIRTYHVSKFMIMLYQKKAEKLKLRWKKSFLINQFKKHDISWRLKQLNDRFIKKTYHENHLKFFVFKIEYLFKSEKMQHQKTINFKKTKKRRVIKT